MGIYQDVLDSLGLPAEPPEPPTKHERTLRLVADAVAQAKAAGDGELHYVGRLPYATAEKIHYGRATKYLMDEAEWALSGRALPIAGSKPPRAHVWVRARRRDPVEPIGVWHGKPVYPAGPGEHEWVIAQGVARRLKLPSINRRRIDEEVPDEEARTWLENQ